ncbi:MarR family transcriptional regulator [Actinospica durhamensis]|uniref:MarR family transcriptional regulator n=1 Tax=Actinospica durhamensis TaxID=1508375 RepID=A0A941EHT0_9ACTN|nr:MarR family transcriptional regulator [Actinospica durhamensis]MBR7832835.1 MarR family transcriptional regulator [Actinospica durhamensis]
MPEDPAPALPAGLEESLSWLLAGSFRAHLAAMREVLGDLPHGSRGFEALCGAAHGSARNQAELAKQLGVDRTVMVYLVDDLERAGLVERLADPRDRRSKLIRATEAGHERLRALQERTATVEAELLSDLSPAEQELLRSLLRRVASRGAGYDLAHACTKDEC